MMMVMTIDYTMRVHFGLRLLDRAADQVNVTIIPVLTGPGTAAPALLVR